MTVNLTLTFKNGAALRWGNPTCDSQSEIRSQVRRVPAPTILTEGEFEKIYLTLTRTSGFALTRADD